MTDEEDIPLEEDHSISTDFYDGNISLEEAVKKHPWVRDAIADGVDFSWHVQHEERNQRNLQPGERELRDIDPDSAEYVALKVVNRAYDDLGEPVTPSQALEYNASDYHDDLVQDQFSKLWQHRLLDRIFDEGIPTFSPTPAGEQLYEEYYERERLLNRLDQILEE